MLPIDKRKPHHLPHPRHSADCPHLRNTIIMKGIELGADDYIQKPFNPNILRTKVKRLIKSREELKKYIPDFSLPPPSRKHHRKKKQEKQDFIFPKIRSS